MPKRVAVLDTVRLNAYALIAEAVEGGILRGWDRAHKHTETPGAFHIRQEIAEAVLLNLTEVLVFSED